MFDMGFEPQVRSICDHVRPDRQCQLYSATFKKRIEKLARDVLSDPVRVAQGDLGSASELVTQIVKVVPLGGYKWQWLVKNLVQFMSEGSIIIFVTKKQNCEELAHNLKVKAEINCRCLQGDMFQNERNEIISAFKKQEFPILVATDVAARGLDISHVRNVINFDLARDIDTHTHRIGRTGRAGVQGTAHTIVTENDLEFAGHMRPGQFSAPGYSVGFLQIPQQYCNLLKYCSSTVELNRSVLLRMIILKTCTVHITVHLHVIL
jgi:ATP-dependent RNA helicase DDX42